VQNSRFHLRFPENNKEVDFEYLLLLCKEEGSQFGSTWGEELNKKLLPYIRNEKLNKLNALYFMSSIKKVILSKYSYNAKATKIELKNKFMKIYQNTKIY
jgi:hypothetical protein